MPHVLRREERLERPGGRALVHADPGVRYPDECLAVARGGFDRQPAAARHGVARVDRQVEQDLLHLGRVGVHDECAGGQVERQLDACADQPADHLDCAGDGVVQVEERGSSTWRRPNERSWDVERCGAIRGELDLAELTPALAGSRLAEQQDLGVAADHGQEVVEVVGDPACQLSDRLHLLGLAQLLLRAACAR